MIGLVLLLAAPVLPRTPEIMSHGWVGGVPDWVLVMIAPREDPWTAWLEQSGQYKQPAPVVGTEFEKLSRSLIAEIDRRMRARSISDGAAVYYLRRVHGDALGRLDTLLRTPAFWPRLQGFLEIRLEYPQSELQRTRRPMLLDADTVEIDESKGTITVGIYARGYTLATVVRRVDFSMLANELMEPVQSTELDAAVARTVRPTLVLKTGEKVDLVLFNATETQTLPCFAKYDCTVFVRGEPLAIRRFNCYPTGHTTAFGERLELSKLQAAKVLAHVDEVEVELHGTLDSAFNLYRFGWQHDPSGVRPKAWIGKVRLKPAIEQHADPGHTAKPPTQLVEPSP